MATPYKPINIKAGERLKFVRKDVLKISDARDLAERMKCSPSSVLNYESGKTEMGIEFLSALNSKFGIQPNYIVLGLKPILSQREEQ